MKPAAQFYIKILVVTVSLLTIAVFQNCSDVKVAQKPSLAPPPTPVIVSSAKPTDKLCAPKGAVFGSPVRIVIILDMSMSNLGSVNSTTINENVYWNIDGTDGPTDPNGLRFDQVKNFIENCGGNVNVKYAVFGFSSAAQFTRGQSCLSPFESQENALRTVEAFKQAQANDKARDSGQGNYPFYMGSTTRYDYAITCLDQKIQEDLTLLTTERPEYHVFFLTDGQPTSDPSGVYGQLNNLLLSTRTSASGMHFQSVYYTSPGAKNQGAEQAAALNILTPMTRVTEGPTGAAIVLANLSAGSTVLCSQIKPQTMVNYSLKTIYAVNLTALPDKNELLADSDMDGISDAEEIALTWDPANYRSTGVLDSLCYLNGKDKAACAAKLATLVCANSNFSFGMSECDRSFATKLFGKAFNTIDTDKDLIPNFVEIIRKSSPFRSDMFENPTSDGVINFEKITKGMDIQSSQALWPVDPAKLLDISYNSDAGICSGGEKQMEYTLNNVPLMEVLNYVDPSDDASIKFSHQKDENVVVVLSVWQSIGGVQLPNRLYVQKWIVPINGAAVSDTPKFIGEF